MITQPRNAMIGAFVVGAVALAVLGMLVFGAGGLLEERLRFSLAFDSSVKGLRVGSPVNFRGVNVGQVTDIKVTIDPKTLDFQVQVDIETEPDAVVPSDGGMAMLQRFNRYKVVDQLIDKGLRAQLQMQSLVTGQLVVELDFLPDTPVRFVGNGLTYKELPTVSSSLNELTKAVGDVPFKELVATAIRAVEGVETLVNSPELLGAIGKLDRSMTTFQTLLEHMDQAIIPLAANMDAAIGDARQLMQDLDGEIAPISQRIQRMTDTADQTLRTAQKTLDSADQTLQATRTTLTTVNEVVDPNSALLYELQQSLRELTAAARSLRILAETLEQQPDALLRGKNRPGDNQ